MKTTKQPVIELLVDDTTEIERSHAFCATIPGLLLTNSLVVNERYTFLAGPLPKHRRKLIHAQNWNMGKAAVPTNTYLHAWL